MTGKYAYIYILDQICFLKEINLYICRHETKQNNNCKILFPAQSSLMLGFSERTEASGN